MKERPILFSGPMVRALLDGRKTQTRRIHKGAPPNFFPSAAGGTWGFYEMPQCPYGQPGDRLLVKEHAWMFCERRPNGVTKTGRPKWHYVPLRAAPVLHCESHPAKPAVRVVHPETGNEWGWRKKLGRYLPSWAVRITLEIVSVRVERLQDISEADAKAEGVIDRGNYWLPSDDMNHPCSFAYGAYHTLWESINGPESWQANPWVWVVEFRRANA